MSAAVTVGLLHPGRMGAAIATQIMCSGHAVLWCPDGRSTATVRRAEAAGLRPAPLGELLANSAVVLSVCPPAVAEEIASMVAGFGYRGSYVEANAISPARMQRITTGSPERERPSSTGASSDHLPMVTFRRTLPRGSRDRSPPGCGPVCWIVGRTGHPRGALRPGQRTKNDLLLLPENQPHWADHTDQRSDLGSILRQLHVPPS
ncbi:MAG: hypothetical protein ACRDRU_06170 [Pseudonocardiaceae bacterium]